MTWHGPGRFVAGRWWERARATRVAEANYQKYVTDEAERRGIPERDLTAIMALEEMVRHMDESPNPNPGSPDAYAHGCSCPVLDNNHGRSAPMPPNNWWIDRDCPIHGYGGNAA